MKLNEILDLHPTTSHGKKETVDLHKQILYEHKKYPEYNVKELSMVCFCGRNVVERCLQANRRVSE